MKKNVRYILFMILYLVLFMGGAEALCKSSGKPAVLLKKANRCRRGLYRSEKKRRYRHNWLRCIRRYQDVYTRYPKSDQAAWALYRSAGLFTALYGYSGKSEDLDEAVHLYRRVADKYRDHRLADDAQYWIGEIFYRFRKDAVQAYAEFSKLNKQFPSGDMRPRAGKMLEELAITLGKRDKERALIVVHDIRHWSAPDYTRVVVDLESPVKYEHHVLKSNPNLKKPRRLYLDLKNARVTSEIDSPIPISDGLLRRVRAGQHKRDTVRIVLDIEGIGRYKIFHLHDPFRIVMDVRRPQTRDEAPNRTVSRAKQPGLPIKRIVIDPGHGGKDPGCSTRGGIKEKDIALSMAKVLSKRIEKEVGCEVFLTRTRDTFQTLEQRTAIANVKKADLFISLHVNAHKDRNIHGLETYFLNIATKKRAVMVAARENATSEKSISDLQAILNDLMMNTKIRESRRLAHEVQEALVSRIKSGYKSLKDLGVNQAPLYVLIGAQMPAILMQTGFLTNHAELKRLSSKTYQEDLAEGIIGGINAYIKGIDDVYKGG
jgi:N-acetylmuramoyl-L-alanine amidase